MKSAKLMSFLVVATAFFAFGCGDDNNPPSSDGGSRDTNTADVGTADSGVVDTGTSDSGTTDTGEPPIMVQGKISDGVYELSPEQVVNAIKRDHTDARIYALGELDHWAKEPNEVKNAVGAILVRNEGVRHIVFEENWQTLAAMNAIMDQGCDDATLRPAFLENFTLMRTSATYPFVKELCEWNQANPSDKVTVYGMDMRAPFIDTHELHDFFSSLASTQNETWVDEFFQCVSKDATTLQEYIDAPEYTKAEHDLCQAAIGSAEAALAADATVSPEERHRITLHLTSLRAGDLEQARFRGLLDGQGPPEAFAGRAEAMRDIFNLHLSQLPADARIIASATIPHTIMDSANVTSDFVFGPPIIGYKNWGNWISQKYGSEYVSVAVTSADFAYAPDGSRYNDTADWLGGQFVEQEGKSVFMPIGEATSPTGPVFSDRTQEFSGLTGFVGGQIHLLITLRTSEYDPRL